MLMQLQLYNTSGKYLIKSANSNQHHEASKLKIESLHMSQVAHQAEAYPGFCSIKRLGYFYSPLDGMLVHRRVTPSIKFAGTHLYTWVERGTVRVKCLAHEHNTMSKARSRTQTTRSGVERTNHEASAPPTRD